MLHLTTALAFTALQFVTTLLALCAVKPGERAIFLWHVGALLLLCAGLALSHPADDEAMAGAVGGIAVNAVYAISLLEIWALADGSFSLRILAWVSLEPDATRDRAIAHFETLGKGKVADRIRSLERLGLVSVADGAVAATGAGRVAAAFLAALSRLSGMRDRG